MNLIVENNVRSKEDLLATEFTISAADLECLCGLPRGWFAREAAEVVSLKSRENLLQHDPSGFGEVIPFPEKKR